MALTERVVLERDFKSLAGGGLELFPFLDLLLDAVTDDGREEVVSWMSLVRLLRGLI